MFLLERLGVRYHLGGSIASSLHGVSRATADADLVAELSFDKVDEFVEQLQAEYYVDLGRAREAVRNCESMNLIHLATMVKVDVFVPQRRAFDQDELSRAQVHSVQLESGIHNFYFKSAEDVVLRKLEWFRAGGGASERQWSDVLGVLKMQGERLDIQYMNRGAAALGLSELLERAFAEARA